MPNNYIPQPIQVHEVKAMQHFRRGESIPYENIYLRSGTMLALPNILIKRLETGDAFGVSIVDLNNLSYGSILAPGFGLLYIDPPVNAYEVAIFDRGDWTLPAGLPDGNYYLKFNSGFSQWWSDEITIATQGTDVGFPQACDGVGYLKLRWRDPNCVNSGKSNDNITNIIVYPPGMDFFVYLKAAALVDAEWEKDTKYGATGSGNKIILEKRFAQKRWKLKGAPVSEAIIDAMQSSAFFDFAELYFPNLTDPLFSLSDVIVEATSNDNGRSYNYEYTFVTDYLLKQGCCP